MKSQQSLAYLRLFLPECSQPVVHECRSVAPRWHWKGFEVILETFMFRSILRPINRRLVEPSSSKSNNRFLREVEGVIHVGANSGQERGIYNRFGLRVIWIEPTPEIFMELRKNLRLFDNRVA